MKLYFFEISLSLRDMIVRDRRDYCGEINSLPELTESQIAKRR